MSKDTADRQGTTPHDTPAAQAGGAPIVAGEGRRGRDDPRAFDLTSFIRARREMRGVVRLGALARMAEELPTDAPADARETPIAWSVRGETRREVRRESAEQGDAPTTLSHTVSQPYLMLEASGQTWLACQRCMQAMAFPIAIDAVYRVMESEEAADAIALDDAEVEVIVGSASFDLVDLVDEEIVLSLPMVPKHEVCPAVHASVVSGADGSLGVESVADIDARLAAEEAAAAKGDGSAGSGRPNPFAALAGLRGTLPPDDDTKQ